MHLSSKLTQNKSIKISTKKPLNFIIHRLFLFLFTVSLTSLLMACTQLQADTTKSYNYPISPDKTNIKHMNIQLMGSVALRPANVNSIPVHELSGIAWDEDEKLLYAVSDEGLLYHLTLTVKDNKLKMLEVIHATQLKDINGLPLAGKYDDSEGLSLINANNGKKGDSELIISFEKKPRITRYNPKGNIISHVKTPKKIRKKKYSAIKTKH